MTLRSQRPIHSARSRISLVGALAVGSLLVALLVAPSLFAAAQPSGDFRVIVHPSNPIGVVGREFLAAAFLKKTTRWSDGSLMRPVDLRSDSAARRKFSEIVLKRSVAAVRNYWQQRIFSGRDTPPPELDSDEAVVRYVTKHRGAVGYVSTSAKLEEAKALAVH